MKLQIKNSIAIKFNKIKILEITYELNDNSLTIKALNYKLFKF